MGLDASAKELRAIAPLIVPGPTPQLVGPVTLVTNGKQTVAFSSAEMLRDAPDSLAIALTFDLTKTIPVSAWTMARAPQMGIIDLGGAFPNSPDLDVEPLSIGSVFAGIDTRGAPSALVTVELEAGRASRRVVPVFVDKVDGGGMSDDILSRLASPDAIVDVDVDADGAALFSWLPADKMLGRPPEVVVVALACRYSEKTYKPRELPPIAELFGLEDLGRALPYIGADKDDSSSNQLGQVAGEIKDDENDPLAGLDIDVET